MLIVLVICNFYSHFKSTLFHTVIHVHLIAYHCVFQFLHLIVFIEHACLLAYFHCAHHNTPQLTATHPKAQHALHRIYGTPESSARRTAHQVKSSYAGSWSTCTGKAPPTSAGKAIVYRRTVTPTTIANLHVYTAKALAIKALPNGSARWETHVHLHCYIQVQSTNI
jgi:hypothetical protein